MPFGLFFYSFIPQIPLSVWGLLILTGLCQTLYFMGLGGAYRNGDLSIVYPLARALPALLVAGVSISLGHKDQISIQCLLGATCVVAGCFVLPMQQFRDFRIDNYFNLSSLFALMAAVGTTGYSLCDDAALRQLRNLPQQDLTVWQITGVYAFFEGISTTFWMAFVTLPHRVVRKDVQSLLIGAWPHALLTGAIIIFTYALVLVSMAFVENVSYVVGFRQLSIPIGAVLGIVWLKEPAHSPKFLGLAILVTGLVLIATG
jgi:drug/metabolite transporter (DMT)-like permease